MDINSPGIRTRTRTRTRKTPVADDDDDYESENKVDRPGKSGLRDDKARGPSGVGSVDIGVKVSAKNSVKSPDTKKVRYSI
jgi:hypothetical protein